MDVPPAPAEDPLPSVDAVVDMQPPATSIYTLERCQQLRADMLRSSKAGYAALRSVLPADVCCRILEDAERLIKQESTLLEINMQDPAVEVIVVGDTHGQFHDVCGLLDLFGLPNSTRTYIFNGDFVDRGAWGVELMMLLVLLKLACPTWVYLLRGNHESSTCTKFYGFKGEVDTKFSPAAAPSPAPTAAAASSPVANGEEAGAGVAAAAAALLESTPQPGVMPPVLKPHPDAKAVYKAFKKLFAALPLAALVQQKTLILHGGLFRHPNKAKSGGKRLRRQTNKLELGCLDDLRSASKGGLDPDGAGASVVAADVLWSDPVGEAGMQVNEARGVGLVFGPDVTQRFLEANSLSLIIRSHEGPDARDKRTDVPQVLVGYAIDHVTPAGNLVTVFSAPDYPQFQEAGTRYNNKGGVAVLKAPGYCAPEFRSFEASLPRPEAHAFYDYLAYADTDEEILGAEEGPSPSEQALSTATDVQDGEAGGEEAGTEAGAGEEGAEVVSARNVGAELEDGVAKRAKVEGGAGEGVGEPSSLSPLLAAGVGASLEGLGPSSEGLASGVGGHMIESEQRLGVAPAAEGAEAEVGRSGDIVMGEASPAIREAASGGLTEAAPVPVLGSGLDASGSVKRGAG